LLKGILEDWSYLKLLHLSISPCHFKFCHSPLSPF
jgi:hypothetical protein